MSILGDSIIYDCPRGLFAILERQAPQSADEFVLTFANRTQWHFRRPNGWSDAERIPLTIISDRNGNYQELKYNDQNKLASVLETVGRQISFVYGGCGLLEALRPEFLQTQGRPPIEIKYIHASNIEHLCAVVSFPTDEFPDGLSTYYEYDEEQPLPEQRSNMTRSHRCKRPNDRRKLLWHGNR